MVDITPSVINNNINASPKAISENIEAGRIGLIYEEVEKARIWAEGTQEEVEKLGGELSSKGWAQSVEGIRQSFDPSTNTWTITTSSPIALSKENTGSNL